MDFKEERLPWGGWTWSAEPIKCREFSPAGLRRSQRFEARGDFIVPFGGSHMVEYVGVLQKLREALSWSPARNQRPRGSQLYQRQEWAWKSIFPLRLQMRTKPHQHLDSILSREPHYTMQDWPIDSQGVILSCWVCDTVMQPEKTNTVPSTQPSTAGN